MAVRWYLFQILDLLILNFFMLLFPYTSPCFLLSGVTGRDAGKIGCTKRPDGEQAEESITVAGKYMYLSEYCS